MTDKTWYAALTLSILSIFLAGFVCGFVVGSLL